MNKWEIALSGYSLDYIIGEYISKSNVSNLRLVKIGDQKYIIKKYPEWFDSDDIEFIQNFNIYMARNGFSTPEILQTLNKSTFVQIDQEHYALFKFVEGKTPSFTNHNELFQAGFLLGKLHRLSESYKPLNNRNWWNLETYKAEEYFQVVDRQKVRNSIQNLQHYLNTFKAGYKIAKNLLLDSGLYSKMSRIIIHGDYETKNLILKSNQLHVLDFDNCREEIKEMDFVDPFRHIINLENEDWKIRAKSFLNGYYFGIEHLTNINIDYLIVCSLISGIQEGMWQLRQYVSSLDSSHISPIKSEANYVELVISRQEELRCINLI